MVVPKKPWLQWRLLEGQWSVGTVVGLLGSAYVLYRSNSGQMAELKRKLRAPVINVASRVLSKHKELVMAFEGGVASFTRTRFDLILIDHGFHTHIDEAFRRAWCKVWAAVGLVHGEKIGRGARGREGERANPYPYDAPTLTSIPTTPPRRRKRSSCWRKSLPTWASARSRRRRTWCGSWRSSRP